MFLKRYLILFSSIAFSFNSIQSVNAVPSDVITLTSVEITNSEYLESETVILRLSMNDPLNNSWSPNTGLTSTYNKTQIFYCPENNWTGTSCSTSSIILSSVSEIQNIEGQVINFEATGTFSLGNYILWRIIFYETGPFEDPHDYRRNQNFVFVSGIFRNDIAVPSFALADFSVIEEIVVEAPAPESDPVVEPVVPTVEPAPPQPTPRVVVSSPFVNSSAPISAVVQANFYSPALKGDENWRPMKEIKGSFQDWRRLKKNSLNGGMNQVTKTNGALITLKSSGDAMSLRYLGGKKRGSFSIYVNGKFLDRVNASKKKKTQLVKTWDGLGKGPHFIDIVAELKPGQSMAINGIQKPRV